MARKLPLKPFRSSRVAKTLKMKEDKAPVASRKMPKSKAQLLARAKRGK